MSIGNPVIQVRVPPEMLEAVAAAARSSYHRTQNGTPDISSWVRAAISDKLAHLRRGNRRRRRRGSQPYMG